MHLNRPVKGQRLDNLVVFSVPRRFCNCYDFFLVFEILNFRQINSTQLPKHYGSLTRGLPRAVVYLDDILVIGSSWDDHLRNLNRFLQCLHEKECIVDCRNASLPKQNWNIWATSSLKTELREAVRLMSCRICRCSRHNMSLLFILSSVQFYRKFLPQIAQLSPNHCIDHSKGSSVALGK